MVINLLLRPLGNLGSGSLWMNYMNREQRWLPSLAKELCCWAGTWKAEDVKAKRTLKGFRLAKLSWTPWPKIARLYSNSFRDSASLMLWIWLVRYLNIVQLAINSLVVTHQPLEHQSNKPHISGIFQINMYRVWTYPNKPF
jgi:hypothetical protein